MKADRLRDMLLTLRFETRRVFGLPGLVGVLMLSVAVAMEVAMIGVKSDTRELRASAQLARTASTHSSANGGGAAANAPAVAASPDWFPEFAQSADDIASIFAAASDSSLTIGSAEYQVAADPGARFTRYQVLLPVKDRYSTIRRFLASVLNDVPNAALQEIHVERPSVDGNVLDARVRIELIYRAARP
ncbi:hypothetical protein [Burkholderia mayonis]|uniref:Uncharacterized protein n=1 Tax=Burkholderia mayonis TaxID=1385591 RepID=A0A1B4G214_9BURK|nr:hypothetical protein [Burkholderia mayonis]AOJ09953.1 hypothetical protein WS71_22060 [Burkholderia mayonis]KVE58694.1 hypothetical protein WS71_24105 [Burkholderia mayonis]